MGLSRLAKACQRCPYVDTCEHKRMEALGYLPMPEIEASNTQATEIKINNMSSSDLTDMIKAISKASTMVNLRINERRKKS